jgi:hypothetical protein
MRKRNGVYRVFVGKPEGKRTLGRPRRRWEDNNEMDLQEAVCGAWTSSIWFGLRWRALVNAAMNFRFPYNAGNFLTS